MVELLGHSWFGFSVAGGLGDSEMVELLGRRWFGFSVAGGSASR